MPASSTFTAPQWVNSLYSKFPLVTLEQDDVVEWKQTQTRKANYSLWVQPPASDDHPHRRDWASSDPSSLRAQLLLLLRGVSVSVRPWTNIAAAPQGKPPTLHLLKENRLIPADDIRTWLDTTFPFKGKDASLHGMPNQEAYDSALATAQLVLVRLLPAYYASLSRPPSGLALMLPEVPALSAGLTTPLPASMTGDDRSVDVADLIENGIEALEALSAKIDGKKWAYGAEAPSPLDALIASHVYCLYGLPAASTLRQKAEESPVLGQYVDAVLAEAEKSLPK